MLPSFSQCDREQLSAMGGVFAGETTDVPTNWGPFMDDLGELKS